MPDNRRSFIKRFGITLGSLIASGALPGCGARKDGGVPDTQSQARKPKEGGLSDARSQAGKPKEPAPTARAAEWEQLRQCWLNLSNREKLQHALIESFETPTQDQNSPTVTRDSLTRKHQVILDTLVASGRLEDSVAKHIQIAFEEASYHVVRSQATCYEGTPIEYAPRQDLLRQGEVLREIPGDLDPATVAKAQAAITQDIAFFEIFKAHTEEIEHFDLFRDASAIGQSLEKDYRAGKLQAGPEELEAARLLTELFLERAD